MNDLGEFEPVHLTRHVDFRKKQADTFMAIEKI